MARIKAPSFPVEQELFEKIMRSFSGWLLKRELIKPPVKFHDRWWIVSTAFVSHSKNEAHLYEVIPIEEWQGDVQVYGTFDEAWIRSREATGMFWHGCRVAIQGDESGRQYVLGAKIQVKVAIRERRDDRRRSEGR